MGDMGKVPQTSSYAGWVAVLASAVERASTSLSIHDNCSGVKGGVVSSSSEAIFAGDPLAKEK